MGASEKLSMRTVPPFQSLFHSAGRAFTSNGMSPLSRPCLDVTAIFANCTGSLLSDRR